MSAVEVREVEEFVWLAHCHDCATNVGDGTQVREEAEADAAYHRLHCPSRDKETL